MKKRILSVLLVLLVNVVGVSSAVDIPLSSVGMTESPTYKPGVIVVKFLPWAGELKNIDAITKTGIPSIDRQLESFSITGIVSRFRHQSVDQKPDRSAISLIYTISFPSEYDPQFVAGEFSRNPHVEYAEPVYLYAIDEAPSDTLYPQQYYLQQIDAPSAWDTQHGDSTILIAVVDNGVDWEHPDLCHNIWTNTAEAEGNPGIDDDNNGWIDDVHGYDLAENDPDPTHCPQDDEGFWVHGTHAAGLAAAVTDNGIGVAGISWNCEYMPVKASRDDSPQEVPSGLDGIVYAAENGADVISLGWGRFGGFSQLEQDVIDYAWSLGSIIVAAGGNVATDSLRYPASCSKVISVSWVDEGDFKVSTATWGPGIDVCAPGVNILSTIPVAGNPQHPYWYISGGSAACPIVAGLCGLVKSLHPDWTNTQTVRQVILTSDNIDYLNPNYTNVLGSGRINAYRALTKTDVEDPPPKIHLLAVATYDSIAGDGDGVFEPGETITLDVVYQNFSLGEAKNMLITLKTRDRDLTIEDPITSVDYVGPDTVMNISQSFSISITSGEVSHRAYLYIDYVTQGLHTGSDTFDVFIFVGPTTLTLTNGMGFPGSSGGTISIDLENSVNICAAEIDIQFDISYLRYVEFSETERVHMCFGFWGWPIQDGVRIIALDCCGLMGSNSIRNFEEGIEPGSGPIAHLTLDVAEDTPLGDYELILFPPLLYDRSYDEISPILVDGLFTVVAQGDVNGDGSIDVLDVILTINIILDIHQPTPGERSIADCNDDGEVDTLDAMCIVDVILEGNVTK